MNEKEFFSQTGRSTAYTYFQSLNYLKSEKNKNSKTKKKSKLELIPKNDLLSVDEQLIIKQIYNPEFSTKKQVDTDQSSKNLNSEIKTPNRIINKDQKEKITTTKKNKSKNLINEKNQKKCENKNNNMYNVSTPECTRYYPKYSLIYPKLLSGPKWEYTSGRKYKKIEIDKRDFFLEKNTKSKCLVNMKTDLVRSPISDSRDVRFQKNYSLKTQLIKKNIISRNFHNINFIKYLSNTTNKSKKDLNNDFYSESNNSRINTYYKNNYSPNKKFNNTESKNHSKNKKIKTIDFSKTISREKSQPKKQKIHKFDFDIYPIYSQIDDRPITLKFDQYEKTKNINSKNLISNPEFNLELENMVKQKNISKNTSPNFDLMIPRPSNKDNLIPSFMLKSFDRAAVDAMNEKSLLLNEFSKGKLADAKSSFNNKKSFNCVINIKMILNNKFNSDYKTRNIKNKIKLIKNKINFPYKKMDKLVIEGALKKFDNVTYKTVRSQKKFQVKNKDIFSMDFYNLN